MLEHDEYQSILKDRIEEQQHINDRLKRSWIHLKRFGNGSDKGEAGEFQVDI